MSRSRSPETFDVAEDLVDAVFVRIAIFGFALARSTMIFAGPERVPTVEQVDL